MVINKSEKKPAALTRTDQFLLIAESDPVNLNYVSALLKRFDYQTRTAVSVADALDIIAEAIPSLIITSAILQDMDGVEFIKQLRTDPRTADIPCIALTREGDLYQEARCFEAGAADCFSHPVSAELLYRTVQTIIEPTPRRNIRVRTMQPVKVTNTPVDGREGIYTLDLSEQGMFVRTAEPAPLNTRLSLQLDLEGQTIPLEAAVLYQSRGDASPYQEPGMGLGFVGITEQDQEYIRNFILEEVMRGLPCGHA